MNRFIDRFAEKPATKLATEYVGKIIAERNRLLANVSNNEKSFFGPIDPQVPASILQLHPDVTVIYSEN